jgi:hypothetical protein
MRRSERRAGPNAQCTDPGGGGRLTAPEVAHAHWLVSVLVQFPIVVVMGLFFWYANRRMARLHDNSLVWRDAVHARVTADLERAAAAHLASKDQEIGRMAAVQQRELRQIGLKIDRLTRKLS